MKTAYLTLIAFITMTALCFGQQYEVTIEEGTEQPSSQGYDSGQSQYYFQGEPPPQYEFQKVADIPPNYIELNASTSTFEARWAGRFSFFPKGLSAGAGIVGSNDDYFYGGIDFTYGTRTIAKEFSFDIGLKGIWGGSEEDNIDADLGAVAFLAIAGWDIPEFEIFSDLYLDLDLWGEVGIAPSPMTFSDSAGFTEARAYLLINLTQNKSSAISLGYRYVDIEFELENAEDWSTDNGIFYFGYRFRF